MTRLRLLLLCLLLLLKRIRIAGGGSSLLRASDVHTHFLRHLVDLRSLRCGGRVYCFLPFPARLTACFGSKLLVITSTCRGIIERDAVNVDRDVLRKVVAGHDHLHRSIGLLQARTGPLLLPDQILPGSPVQVVALGFERRGCARPILANF